MLVLFAIINSTLAVGIACTNAATRVMYTMSQAGTLPSALGKIHPVHKTPYIAVHVEQIFQIVSFGLVGIIFGASQIFGFLGTITTLAVIVLYIMANIALTAFVRREHPEDFNILRHVIVPLVGTVLLIPVLYVTIISGSNLSFQPDAIRLYSLDGHRIRRYAHYCSKTSRGT